MLRVKEPDCMWDHKARQLSQELQHLDCCVPEWAKVRQWIQREVWSRTAERKLQMCSRFFSLVNG